MSELIEIRKIHRQVSQMNALADPPSHPIRSTAQRLRDTLRIIIACLLTPCLNAVEDVDWAAIATTLQEPATLVLVNQQEITGQLTDFVDDRVVLSQKRGDGVAEFRIRAEEIRQIEFSGSHWLQKAADLRINEQFDAAMRLYTVLWEKFSPWLRFLHPDIPAAFLPLAHLHRDHGNPFQSASLYRELRPFARNPEEAEAIDNHILVALYRLPIKTDAAQLARDWLAANPVPTDSALGHFIAAHIALIEANHQQALETALAAVATATDYHVEWLPHCYVIAVEAARRSEQIKLAQRLAVEMQTRRLAWPNFPELEQYREQQRKLLKKKHTNETVPGN